MKYGDKFKFVDKKYGKLPSECMSFKYSIDPKSILIFIKKYSDGTFMYCSLAGQHTRDSKALKYCKKLV